MSQQLTTANIGSDFVLRAAFGGVLGAPIFLGGSIVRDIVGLGHVAYGGALELIGLPVFMFYGCIIGILLGSIFWVLVATTGMKLRPIIRVVIGICLVLFVHLVLSKFNSDRSVGLVAPSTTEAVTNILLYVASFGALPALIAAPGAKNLESRHSSKNLPH